MPAQVRNIVENAPGNPLFTGNNVSVQNLVNQLKLERNSTYATRPDYMSYADILLLQPEIGRIVYDTTNEIERFYNGTVWVSLSSSATSVGQRAVNWSSLSAGITIGDLAYTNQSEGTQWLPGTLGGTYYPAGWYLWTGTEWVSDRNSIVNQLQLNVEGLGGKSDIGHVHSKSEISDFSDADYATAAQGILADLALINGSDISLLNNDAGFITANALVNYRSDAVGFIVYSGYLFNAVPIIAKDTDGVLTYAQNVTNLETDWTNRLTLTYI